MAPHDTFCREFRRVVFMADGSYVLEQFTAVYNPYVYQVPEESIRSEKPQPREPKPADAKPKLSKQDWEDQIDCHLFFSDIRKAAKLEGEYDEFGITKSPKCQLPRIYCRCLKCIIHRKKLRNFEKYRNQFLSIFRLPDAA